MLEPSKSAVLDRSDRLELWAFGEGDCFACECLVVEWLLCFSGVCTVFLIYLWMLKTSWASCLRFWLGALALASRKDSFNGFSYFLRLLAGVATSLFSS